MDKSQLPKMIKKLHLFLLLLCSLIGLGGYAQTFPIRITTQLTQPSPIYLSNYADANTINSPIKIQLVLNDLTISNRQVRLKIYFQGNGIAFNTNDFVVGAKPLYLEGGFPLQLTNVDLAPYFEYQNLLGVTPNQYAQPLPEGVYNIYVEVYDFATNRKLSSKTGSTTIIFQNDPPFLNLPLNNASIMQQNIQNIVFGWTPRSINVSNVEYEFSLVEIWDKYTPVQNAFAYSPPLYTTTTRTTSLQYGMNQPQLIPGKKYAWRVKAKALLGAEEIGVFKNNGYSEIFSFDYEVFCTSPLAINTEGISENQAKITWTGSIDNFDYQVKYREKNSGSEWYDVVTPRETSTISNLKPNTTYEYSVGSSCDVGKYTHSTIKEFTTLVRDEIAFQGCGIKPDPNDLANKNPLPSLFPNDVIAAGDFPIVVIHATGSNGNFSGDGYVTLPFLEKFRKLIDAADALGGDKINIGQFSRIRITFNNIGLNTDFKLISGEIIAAYDPNWSSMVDGDKVLTDVLGSDGKPVQGKVDFEVKSTTLNPDGSTTIIGTDGQTAVIPKSSYDQVYTDSKGNTVTIPANGKGEPTLSSPAEGGKAVAANTNGMSSSGEVTQISSSDVTITFSDSSNSKYAFDPQPAAGSKKLLDSYETLTTKSGGTYKINYKAVSDLDGSDKIIAKADFKNGKTNKDIVFKTNTGAAVEATWTSASQAEITLTKKLDFAKQSIVATVKGSQQKNPADSTKTIEGKSDIAGKINVWELTKKPAINITLLSLNKASAPSADEAKKFLNAVYNKAGITFDVTSQSLTVGTLPNEIECGDSDLLNVYTGGQKNIIGQIESSADFKYNEKTYYVLYTGKTGQNGFKGFMPLGGQYAFVFDNTLKTAAHELGHGIFGLKHPFSTATESGKTDLLMDYGTGTVLSHNDWDIIHSGGWKFYGFQKSSSGASRTNDGIDILGNVISKVDINENSTKTTLAGVLSKSTPFLRVGYFEYSKTDDKLLHKYLAVIKNNKVLYIDDITQEEMPYKVTTTELGSPVISELGAECTYSTTLITNWIKPENSNTEAVINLIRSKINEQKPQWEPVSLYKNDPSCGIYNTWEDIKTNDQNCSDAKINKETQNLKDYLAKNYSQDKISEVVDEINKNCIGTLKNLNYEIVLKYIKLISSQKSLFKANVPDKSEIAILRLITTINFNKYKQFFKDLEATNNELLKLLIEELDDHSIFYWDGNNYNNFIKALSFMQGQLIVNDNDYVIETLSKTDEQLFKQSINLTKEKITGQPDWDTNPSQLVFFRTRNIGKYDKSTGLITIQEVHSTIAPRSSTSPEVIEIPGTPIDIAKVSPLTPIVFHVGNRGTLLEKVNLALDGVSKISDNSYIAPAIFFKYNADKDLDDEIQKVVMTGLDVLTLYGAKATLVKDVSKAKRIWVMMEVAGAFADIATKTTPVSPKVQEAVDIYNMAMGLIGLKNLSKGSVYYLSNLPSEIKEAIKTNNGIRNLLIAQYTRWKIAVSNLKPTPAEKELITQQEKVFKALGIFDDVSHTISNLTKLDELILNSKFLSFFNKLPKNKSYFASMEAFKAEFIRLHEACNANSVKNVEDFTEDFIHFIDNSLSKVKEENAIEFMKEMMQTSDKFKAGGTSLEVIRNPSKYIDNVDDLEDLEDLISTTPTIDGEFRFDILFRAKENAVTYKVFVDTKNYSATAGIFKELAQIKAYIKEIKSFKEFRIIQQARPGINAENLKKAFQTAIGKEAKDFFMSNESLFKNSGIDNYTVLQKLCDDKKLINHPIMDIIQVTK